MPEIRLRNVNEHIHYKLHKVIAYLQVSRREFLLKKISKIIRDAYDCLPEDSK